MRKLPELESVFDTGLEDQERALAAALRWKQSQARVEAREQRIARGVIKFQRMERKALKWIRWALGIKPWKPARIDYRHYHVEVGGYDNQSSLSAVGPSVDSH